MTEQKLFDAVNRPTEIEKKELVNFLYDNLEQYGDKKKDIQNALEYATKEISSFGGFIMTSFEGKKMLGVVVINRTGMKGYIPENILVYIATHKESRGKGIGKKLMETAINYASGDVALHVEADNPARFLYEKLGFQNPYLEMRLKKS